MQNFSNVAGSVILPPLFDVIEENKQVLSDIDGLIGDGDHGINMNKGFQLCKQSFVLEKNMSEGLKLLGTILLEKIGGAMGPLYGSIFRSMARVCKNCEQINGDIFQEMLQQSESKIRELGDCVEGEKTLLDVLAPASKAFKKEFQDSRDFSKALSSMKLAAIQGRDATVAMRATKGRASRLGDRSIGVADAGATSCCLILNSIADSILKLIQVRIFSLSR